MDLASIPGVRVRGTSDAATVTAPLDLLGVLRGRGVVGVADLSAPRAVDESRIGGALRQWQREGALRLARGEARVLWWSAGIGKSLALLTAADLVGARRVLIVTRALGRDVFARDSVLMGGASRRRVAIVIGEGPPRGDGAPLETTPIRPDGVVIYSAPPAHPLTPAQQGAVRRADKALGRHRDAGADCLAVGSVAAAVEAGAWAVVVGWEVLAAHEAACIAARFDVLILDEAHCGKAYNSARTRASHRIAALVPTVWGSTATPVPDRVRDLWGQLYAVGGRAAWGTSLKFARRYAHAIPGRFGGWETDGPHKIGCDTCARTSAELRERLAWWSDRRNRRVIAAMLPAITRALVRVAPSDDAVDDASERPARRGGIEAAVAYAASAKVKAVATLCAEALVAGERVVVAGNRRAWVPRMVKAIQGALPQGLKRSGRAWLHGFSGEDAIEARKAVAAEFCDLRLGATEQWQAGALVTTIDAVKTSIDLFADTVIVAALPWTPEALEQFEGRFPRLRFGPQHRIRIVYTIAQGTIDDAIEDTLLGKLSCLAEAGAEVDGEARAWMSASAPTEAEVLAALDRYLASRAEVVARAVAEGEGAA